MECHRPPLGIVENVPEFQKWALFPAWSAATAVSEKAAVKSLNAARYKMGRMEFFPNYGHPLFGK